MKTRLRWATIGATTIVCGALVFANLDGYQNEPFGGGHFFGEPPLINWAHGWPSICLVRSSIAKGRPGASLNRARLGTNGTTNRWPFDNAEIYAFYVNPCLVDLSFFVAVLIGTAYATPRFLNWLTTFRSFSLKSLIIATALLAVLFAAAIPVLKSDTVVQFANQCFDEHTPSSTKVRYLAQLSAIGMIAIGALMAAFALVHFSYA